ncbi:hypothetical protein FRC17_006507 [Serendipita sp. 399]|nr:hypothetical protein FRC17_006507 [Serendipita sp. 399]
MDELQDEFFASIESRVDIFEARNPTAAIKGLRFPRVPIAVIIMDGLKPRTEAHKALLTALLGYAKNEPGIVIFAFGFPSFQIPPDIAEVFETFGVYWSRSNYSREMFHLNNARVAPSDREVLKSGKGDSSATATAGKELGALQELIRDSGQILAPSYSMKALQLSGVSAEDAVYVYERDLIKKPKGRVKENRLVDAAVALTRVGKGRVAYIGDVNSESMTELLVRAMIGLEPGSPRTDRQLTVQLS